MLQDATIFITGGAGFIGSRLAGRLADANQVTIFDNLRRNALAGTGLEEHPNVRVVAGDVLDRDALQQAMAGSSHVVHCAAIAGIDTVSKSPVTTLEVNVLGSAAVLAAAHATGVQGRVVCISTSEIYGGRAYRVDERAEAAVGAVGEPRWTYAVGKLAEEHWAIAYHTEHGLPTTVVRPFNVYGPGQVGEGAMRAFVTRAVHNEPITIHNDGAQIRAWCFVDDMVRGLLAALEHPAAVGESFNIGNARSVATMTGLAEMVVRITKSSSPIVFQPREGADIELRIPATDKARDLLGFEAQVDLEEGIARTADWARALA